MSFYGLLLEIPVFFDLKLNEKISRFLQDLLILIIKKQHVFKKSVEEKEKASMKIRVKTGQNCEWMNEFFLYIYIHIYI